MKSLSFTSLLAVVAVSSAALFATLPFVASPASVTSGPAKECMTNAQKTREQKKKEGMATYNSYLELGTKEKKSQLDTVAATYKSKMSAAEATKKAELSAAQALENKEQRKVATKAANDKFKQASGEINLWKKTTTQTINETFKVALAQLNAAKKEGLAKIEADYKAAIEACKTSSSNQTITTKSTWNGSVSGNFGSLGSFNSSLTCDFGPASSGYVDGACSGTDISFNYRKGGSSISIDGWIKTKKLSMNISQNFGGSYVMEGGIYSPGGADSERFSGGATLAGDSLSITFSGPGPSPMGGSFKLNCQTACN